MNGQRSPVIAGAVLAGQSAARDHDGDEEGERVAANPAGLEP
jgi:hypothetical protein